MVLYAYWKPGFQKHNQFTLSNSLHENANLNTPVLKQVLVFFLNHICQFDRWKKKISLLFHLKVDMSYMFTNQVRMSKHLSAVQYTVPLFFYLSVNIYY